MKIIKKISFVLPFLTHNTIAQEPNKMLHHCVDHYQQSQFEDAYQACLPLAEKNNPMAQFIVGHLLERGLGVAQNEKNSIHWLKKSADLGNASAQLKLAKHYCKGSKHTPINHAKAVQYLHQSAQNKESEAQFMLALCYFKGIGVKQSFEDAHHWYNQAALSGLQNSKPLEKPIQKREINSSAQAQEAYQIATQISLDEEGSALESDLIWRALAAEKNHPQAQYDLCRHYLRTARTNDDIQIALKWLHSAAQNQHQEAQSHLAWITALGIDTPENLNLAIEWFKKACDPTNTITMDLALDQNREIKQAIELLETASNDYEIVAALRILEESAKKESTDAQFYLAKLYLNGKHVHQDKLLAAHLFEKAALKGHLEAQHHLGWMYLQGNGIPRQWIQAYYWLNKAGMIPMHKAKQYNPPDRLSLNL